MQIGSRMHSIEWWHCRWPWVTLTTQITHFLHLALRFMCHNRWRCKLQIWHTDWLQQTAHRWHITPKGGMVGLTWPVFASQLYWEKFHHGMPTVDASHTPLLVPGTPCMNDSSSLGARRCLEQDATNTTRQRVLGCTWHCCDCVILS